MTKTTTQLQKVFFVLQKVDFVKLPPEFRRQTKFCLNVCRNCTPPQVLHWQSSVKFSSEYRTHVVALPGEFESVKLRCLVPECAHIKVNWLETQQITLTSELMARRELKAIFTGSNLAGFENLMRRISVSNKSFIFLKNADVSHNYKYHRKNEDKYFKPCPNHTHTPLYFSWQDTHGFCKKIYLKCALPTFIDKREQDEFVNTIKHSRDLFSMQAIFLSLRSLRKAQVNNETSKI